MTRIKFCGFTRTEDVTQAVRLGVDFIGLNFVQSSPRRVSLDRALCLGEAARSEAAHLGVRKPALVGVFSLQELGLLTSDASVYGLDYLQLHGCGPDTVLPTFDRPYILAWRLGGPEGPPELSRWPAWAHLVDAYDPQRLGGTGQCCDWGIAAGLARQCRLFLAGGLRPNSVGAAIRQVRPYAVDVASGIEAAPGVKDWVLMRDFVSEVRRSEKSG